jgi:alpha-L-fucosidase
VAKEAGCRYAVLGTKHHDGFCLWPTKTKDLHSVNHGPKRDLVGPFVEATRKAGLKVGLYISLIDWEDPDFASMPGSIRFSSPVHPVEFDPARWQRFLQRLFKQVEELLTNYGKIDILWFDVPGWGGDIWHADELKMMMLGLQPHIICNDLLTGAGDFTTPEQQIPPAPIAGPWETNMTTNETWGFHPDPTRYKSARTLVRNLCEIRSLGGNLLLNVGPDGEARFPEIACERLREIGSWLSKSGESIYGAERGLDERHFWGPSTRNGNTLYCHLPAIPDPDFELRGIADDPRRVFMLQSGQDLPFRRVANRIVIDCGGATLDPLGATVAVEFAEPPASLQFTSTVFTARGTPLW